MTATLKSLESRQRIDPVGQVELLLNQVFLSVFQTEAARSRFGFTHISPQVSFDGFPGWYLWFSDRSGAFLLRVLTGCDVPTTESNFNLETVQGIRLGVFYYPHIEEKDFEGFSWPEKILRCSDYFDQTGTPTSEGRKEIPSSFFLVGQIDIRLCSMRCYLELECSALERWRDYRVGGLHVRGPSGDLLEVVAAGDRDRDVPGWELTHFLMDKLVLGICFQQRLTPIAVLVSKEEGFASYLQENQQIEQRIEPGISEMNLSIGLSASPGGDSTICRRDYAAAAQRLGRELIDFMTGGSPPPDKRRLWINPEWWQAKNEPFEPATICGCCHHEH